jgi:hypothetical protein
MAQTQETPQTGSVAIWQQWAKKRAQKAPSLKRIHEIARDVHVNVTQLLLDEHQEK